MPEGWRFNPVNGGVFAGNDIVISLLFMRALLATQGLRIIGKEEAAVLDASWAIPDGTLAIALRAPNADNWVSLPGSIVEHLKAELSRRGAKP